MGDEQAETYLTLLAEAELRRAGDELRALDAATGPDDLLEPGMSPFRTNEITLWKIARAGQILVAAGVLDQEYLDDVAADLHLAIEVRSQLLLSAGRRRSTHSTFFFGIPGRRPPLGSSPPRAARRAPQVTVTPVGQALPVAGDRASWTLHLMTLVRTEAEALVTVAMRMHWPPDGSSAELELTGAGPHHMPYDRLGAVDDRGTRYTVRFDGGRGGPAAWLGVAWLSPVPPRGARWLDLIGDGTRLIRLPLGAPAPASRRLASPATERVALEPGERLLVLAAEHILATGGAPELARDPGPGEIITLLREAGAIAPGSPVPGQLATLCQRLGVAGPGITVPPGEELPARWASVIAHRDAPAGGPEVFAPLAEVLPDVDGASFALAGLSTVAGESYLHVVSRGRLPGDGTPGFSWWLGDSAGNWHVGSLAEPDDSYQNDPSGDGLRAFWLRLTPPLTAAAGPAEVVVSGPATQARAPLSR